MVTEYDVAAVELRQRLEEKQWEQRRETIMQIGAILTGLAGMVWALKVLTGKR